MALLSPKLLHMAMRAMLLAFAQAVVLAVVPVGLLVCAQRPGFATGASADPLGSASAGAGPATAVEATADKTAEAALQRGIALARRGEFAQAIAPLEQAQGRVAEAYAAQFNLGLAYLGTARYGESVQVLGQLIRQGGETAAVDNLLAQDQVALNQPQAAYLTAERAAGQAPLDEKLYAYLADACTDHAMPELGLRLTAMGLSHLPASARLHYERAVFLARLDRLPEARPEFARAFSLDPAGYIGSLARVQVLLYDDRFDEAAAVARAAFGGLPAGSGAPDARLRALLGIVLVAQGVVPGQPGFAEARQALEASVAARPSDPSAQAALGALLLRAGDDAAALPCLLAAQHLEPGNRAVYPGLATVYRHLGQPGKADQWMHQLAELLKEQSAAAPAPVAPE